MLLNFTEKNEHSEENYGKLTFEKKRQEDTTEKKQSLQQMVLEKLGSLM